MLQQYFSLKKLLLISFLENLYIALHYNTNNITQWYNIIDTYDTKNELQKLIVKVIIMQSYNNSKNNA
jgi:hypothetical protein